tara:strand:- start:132 stop:365 length:234 start_codon:yes stop_codon:yes gene_type:complete
MEVFIDKLIKTIIAISLVFMGIQVIPISKRAKIWNNCIESTVNYLESNEKLRLIKAPALQWMAISICNGNGAKNRPN